MGKEWILTLGFGMLLAMALGGCRGGNGQKASSPASEAPGKAVPAVKVSRDNPCSVMFPNEVGEILGVPSGVREIVDEATCHYHFEATKDSQPKSARDETFIEVKIHWTEGRTAVTALRMAGKLMGSSSGGFEKLSGIGDEAWLAPLGSYLAFSKGGVGVEIDMRMMPEREKAVRLARLIASRL